MPEGMTIKLHQAASGTTASNNPFMAMAEWCEKSAARLILGQTLTSGADGQSSTHALGVVHNEVRRDLLVSDAKRIAQTVTQQIIAPYLMLNFAGFDPARCPAFEFDTRETADLAAMADALPKLVDVGVQIPEPWVREKLAIPDVQDGEAVLGRKSAADNPVTQAALAALAAKPSAAGGKAAKTGQRILDDALDEALGVPDFNAQLNPVLKQAVAAVMAAESFEEADAALTALYPDLDGRTLETHLQQALFLSDLLGQHDARH